MKIDQSKEPSAATVVGWMVLALGLLIWLSVIPLTGTALFLAEKITVEAGFATFGGIGYGIVGAVGLSFIVASEHRSARPALLAYGLLLLAAVVVVVLLRSHA